MAVAVPPSYAQPVSEAERSVPPVDEILRARTGEELDLGERYLNPQMGRIVRTLGFDKVWVGGEGAHLIDADGERYLDLFGGYGVFAIGRNHPEAVAAIEAVLAARTGNLPQLGVTLLSGVLAEQLIAARAGERRGCRAREQRHRGGRGGDQDRARRHRSRRASSTPSTPSTGSRSARSRSTATASSATASNRCCRAASAFPSATSTRSRASSQRGDVAAFVVEPIQGKGVNVPPDGYLPGAQNAVPGGRSAVRLRRGADGHRAHRSLPRARALGARTRHRAASPRRSRAASCRSARCSSRGRRSTRCSTAWNAPCGTARRSAATTSPRLPGSPRCACSTRRTSSTRSARMGELLLELTAPLVERYEVVRDVRGLGLMWAIEFGPPSGAAARRLFSRVEERQPGLFAQLVTVPLFKQHRIFCQVAGHHLNVIKALPALTVEESELRRFAAALEQTIAAAERYPSALARFGVRTGVRAALARR